LFRLYADLSFPTTIRPSFDESSGTGQIVRPIPEVGIKSEEPPGTRTSVDDLNQEFCRIRVHCGIGTLRLFLKKLPRVDLVLEKGIAN
jgi:hypothetical protein